MNPVGKPENLKSDHKKEKKSFFRGVSNWLIGSAKPKRKTEEIPLNVPPKPPIPYDEDPKLVDTDIIKSSAREHDASETVIPTSLEIKAKLMAVDNYYRLPRKPEAGRNAPFFSEEEKERPSWGYIMERPLVEQYVLMNNYIRKASVLAELENIEEQERTGKKEGIKEYETDTDISLPSDYETELNHYNNFCLSKKEEQKKSTLPLSQDEQESTLKSILKNEAIVNTKDIPHETTKQKFKKTYHQFKKFSRRKRRVIKIPSDSDPPISYASIPSVVEKRRKIGQPTEEPQDQDKSGILTNLGFNLTPDTPSDINRNSSDSESLPKPSIMKGRGLTDAEIQALKIYNEQQLLLKKVSSPYVANIGDDSDDSIPSQPQGQQKNVDFSSKLNVYEYEQQQDLISDIVEDKTQLPEIKEDEPVISSELNVKSEDPIEHFKPSNIISPMSVLRIQAEQAKNVPEDLGDKVLKVLTNKKFNYRHGRSSLPSGSKEPHEKKRFSFMKDFGTFEPNSRDSSPGKKESSQEQSEIDSEPSSVHEKPIKMDKSIGPKEKIMIINSPTTSGESLTPVFDRTLHLKSDDEKEMMRKNIFNDRPDLYRRQTPRRRSISCESRAEYRRSQSVESEKSYQEKIPQAEFRALLIEQPQCSAARYNEYENRQRMKERYIVSPDSIREIYTRQESDSYTSAAGTTSRMYRRSLSDGMQTSAERQAMWADTPLFYARKPLRTNSVERTPMFEDSRYSQISDERRKSDQDGRIINLVSEDFELDARIKIPQEKRMNMKRRNTFIRE